MIVLSTKEQGLEDQRAHGEGWALVLSGGGNQGAIQAGAVLALFETGFAPDLIVGVSVGAINGAYLAFRPNVDGARDLIEIWRELDGRTLFGSRFPRLRTLAALVTRRDAAFSNQGLRDLMALHLPSDRFEETTVPFAVATHLDTGTPRSLAVGSIVRAVLASAAVPAHFPPIELKGELRIDGAITDPVPLHEVWERGFERAVLVDTGYACDCPRVYESGLAIVQRSIAILSDKCRRAELARGAGRVQVLHIGLSCHADVPMTDLSHADEMAKSGYEEAKGILRSFEEGPPWSSPDASDHILEVARLTTETIR